MNDIDPIEEELAKAGEATSVSPFLVKLDKFRIMSDTDVPPEEFLMRLFGKPCFPRRDLSAVTGTEKCGKTFFTSMLMACCAEKSVLELERISDRPLKVMWYDTEQSRQSTKNILANRVFKLVRPHTDINGHTDDTDGTDINGHTENKGHTDNTDGTDINGHTENKGHTDDTDFTDLDGNFSTCTVEDSYQLAIR